MASFAFAFTYPKEIPEKPETIELTSGFDPRKEELMDNLKHAVKFL